MRVIDADALRKRIKAKNASNAMMKAMREKCVAEIDDTPTIELIRCKDCKHWNEDGMCRILKEYIFNDDFFCVNAERKEGADG